MIEFVISKHTINPNRRVIELWDGGVFIGQLTSNEGAVRLISKHEIETVNELAKDNPQGLNAITFRIKHPGSN